MEIGQSNKEKYIVVINSYSKKKLSHKKMKFLLSSLSAKFDIVDIFHSKSVEQFSLYLKEKINEINGLFLLGGDGSVHHLLNLNISFPQDFKVGLIPFGTLNDTHKNINNTRNFYKSIKRIVNSEPAFLKMMNINDNINSLFSISFGTFSNIPYLKKYKKCKRLSYYFSALKILFSKNRKISFYLDDKEINTYFLFVLKGKYLAGFNLNKVDNLKENNMYISYSKMNFLKGLPSYFIRSKKRVNITKEEINIKFFNVNDVSIDGEKYSFDHMNIIIKNTPFKIFSFIK